MSFKEGILDLLNDILPSLPAAGRLTSFLQEFIYSPWFFYNNGSLIKFIENTMVEVIHERTTEDSSSSLLIAVVVVLLLLIVGWFAYNGGFLGGARDDGPDVIDVNLNGGTGGGDGGGGTGGGGGVTY